MSGFLKKKTIGFYLTLVVTVLMLLQLVMYLSHVSDRVHPAVIVLVALSLMLYIVNMLKPIKYLEFAPMFLYLTAMVIYFSTEAAYISVCMLAVDDSFTTPYIVHIILTVVVGALCITPPIFKQEK